jgi:hypothetical protein
MMGQHRLVDFAAVRNLNALYFGEYLSVSLHHAWDVNKEARTI